MEAARRPPEPPRTNGLHPKPTAGGQQQQQQPQVVSPTNPICRCRVMYLGSSVPHITKDGLQGIQEPLRELYPVDQAVSLEGAGIDSWLSIWSNGILIENVDETGREVKRFFKIEALHYCAAVKYVEPSQQHQYAPQQVSSSNQPPRFLPLDSPHSRQPNPNPPVFASIIRRTTGIKVLECHAFICKREAAANALVRCCFHAYADTMYAKQLCSGADGTEQGASSSSPAAAAHMQPSASSNHLRDLNNNHLQPESTPSLGQRKSKSIANLTRDLDAYQEPQREREVTSSLARRKSSANQGQAPYLGGAQDTQDYAHHQHQANLKKQSKFSKSMHHLDQANQVGFQQAANQALYQEPLLSQSNGRLASSNRSHHQAPQVPPTIPFHTPYSARIPSYPPQGMEHPAQATSHGGTLRSIKSMAANSIASTLLRSKKHAKATSMAHLNQTVPPPPPPLPSDKVISFHQPHLMMNGAAATLGRPVMMPPVPAMFLAPPPPLHHMMNGSQTMKPASGRPPVMPAHLLGGNFEAMTPKEMKKLLKKSAKYGLDPMGGRFDDNGLPLLPLKPPGPLLHLAPVGAGPLPGSGNARLHHQQHQSRSGTMVSQYSDLYSDYGGGGGGGGRMGPPPAHLMGLPPPPMAAHGADQMKPLLVKPNPEFLKSKAGKKWLKQQKEFKKLLPPHLEGLPIIFGPPPLNALEPAELAGSAAAAMNGLPMPPVAVPPGANPFMPGHPGLPVLDSSGYYNPHPFYGGGGGGGGLQNGCGRASAASTLLRYSPHSHPLHHHHNHNHHHQQEAAAAAAGYGLMYHNNPDCWPPAKGQPQAMMASAGNGVRDHYSDDSSSMAALESQHDYAGVDPRMRNLLMEGSNGLRRKPRNHMVEQSVISLGDEHDFDDDDDDDADGEVELDQNGADHEQADHRALHNDTYTVSSAQQQQQQQHGGHLRSARSQQQVAEKHAMSRANGNNNGSTSDQLDNDAYSQPTSSDRSTQQNDDQGSYSSGIYRRGHLNERAFSYSIRQEHKSNGADADYSIRNDIHHPDHQQEPNNNNHNHNNHNQYQTHQQAAGGNIYQAAASKARDKTPLEYYRDNNDTRSIPVNELTARLENQLNMRSFANSRIKSHI